MDAPPPALELACEACHARLAAVYLTPWIPAAGPPLILCPRCLLDAREAEAWARRLGPPPRDT